jgi:hypothetical protein
VIDVHYVIYNAEKQKRKSPYFGDFLQSLSKNKGVFREVDNRGSSLTTGRYVGFNVGSNRIVAAVDPDDLILPGVIESCISIFREDSVALVTQEYKKTKNNITISPNTDKLNTQRLYSEPSYLHHIPLFKRFYVNEFFKVFYNYLDFTGDTVFLDWLLVVVAHKINRLQYVPFPGYLWRIHENNYHHLSPWKSNRTRNFINSSIFETLAREISYRV